MFWLILKCLLAALAAFAVLWILKSESGMINFLVAAVMGFVIYYIIPDSKGVGSNRLRGLTMDSFKKALVGCLVGLSGFFWMKSLNESRADATKRNEMVTDRVLVDDKIQLNFKTVKYTGIMGWLCLIGGTILSCVTNKNVSQALSR